MTTHKLIHLKHTIQDSQLCSLKLFYLKLENALLPRKRPMLTTAKHFSSPQCWLTAGGAKYKVVRNLSLFCFCCQVIYLSSNTRLAQLAVPTAGLHSSDRGIIVWPPISLAKAPRCINNCQSSLIKNFFENQSAQVYQTQLFTTCLQSHLFSLFFFLDLYFYTVVVNGSVQLTNNLQQQRN